MQIFEERKVFMTVEGVSISGFEGFREEENRKDEKKFRDLPRVLFSVFPSISLRSRSIQRSFDAGGSVSVGIDVSWGGKDGCEVSGYVEGEVHDKDGNYVEGKVEQNSDGTGGAHVSAGHKDD